MSTVLTDGKWFEFLRKLKPDEVNFWRPSAATAFKAIDYGAPFLFKLHKPNDFIVGGGFFSGYSRLPLSMAWQAFGEKNGAANYSEFRERISLYRSNHGLTTIDPYIGSIVLSNPFFFDEEDWIEPPSNWGTGIMQGKTYDLSDQLGTSIWNAVFQRLQISEPNKNIQKTPNLTANIEGAVFGKKYLQTTRLGQGAFRVLTLENYRHKCCITGETTIPVLEAAHIKPVTQGGNHYLGNGLLLRADLHILFDKGLVGVDPDYKIRVSPEIAHQYLNGKVYYAHNGEPLRSLPNSPELRPSTELLDWHMKNVFIN